MWSLKTGLQMVTAIGSCNFTELLLDFLPELRDLSRQVISDGWVISQDRLLCRYFWTYIGVLDWQSNGHVPQLTLWLLWLWGGFSRMKPTRRYYQCRTVFFSNFLDIHHSRYKIHTLDQHSQTSTVTHFVHTDEHNKDTNTDSQQQHSKRIGQQNPALPR